MTVCRIALKGFSIDGNVPIIRIIVYQKLERVKYLVPVRRQRYSLVGGLNQDYRQVLRSARKFIRKTLDILVEGNGMTLHGGGSTRHLENGQHGTNLADGSNLR